MNLFIDADACPVTADVLRVARRAGINIIIAGNTTQNLARHIHPDDPRDKEHAKHGFWADTLEVSTGADSADFAIVERLSKGNIMVTQDIGLAGIVLGRDARAIDVRGRIYDPLPSIWTCISVMKRKRYAAQVDEQKAPLHLPSMTGNGLSRISRGWWGLTNSRHKRLLDNISNPTISPGTVSSLTHTLHRRLWRSDKHAHGRTIELIR